MADDYAAWMDRDDARDGEKRALGAVAQARQVNPDELAEGLTAAAELDVAPSLSSTYLEVLRDARAELRASTALKSSPGLARWVEKPENAAVAHDDLDALSWWEKGVATLAGTLAGAPHLAANPQVQAALLGVRAGTAGADYGRFVATNPRAALDDVKSAPQQFAAGREDVELGELGFKVALGTADQQERARFEALKANRMAAGQPFGPFGATARVVPQFGQALATSGDEIATGASTFAGVAALAGQAGPQVAAPEEVLTVPGAALTGAGVGLQVGQAKASIRMNTGLAYAEFSELRDEQGQPLDPTVARVAAGAVGVLAGSLDAVGFAKLTDVVGLDKLTRPAVARLLERPSVRAALLDVGKKYGIAVGTEGATEAAQEAIQILAGELAKGADGDAFEGVSLPEAAERVGEAGKQGLMASALLAGAGAAPNLTVQVGRAKRAEQAQAAFEAIAGNAGASKLKARLPDRYQAFVDHVTKDGPAETVYVDADGAQEFFQSQGTTAPEALAQMGLDHAQIEAALREGGLIAVPTSVWAAKIAGTPLDAALRPHAKFDPEGMTAKEREGFEANYPELVAQYRQAQHLNERAQRGEDANLTAAREEIAARLRATNRFTEDQVSKYAELTAGAYANLAERAGVPLDQFLADHPLPQVLAGGSTARRPAPATSAPPAVAGVIQRAAEDHGASVGYLTALARRESSFNPKAQAAGSSARGLYQFVKATWLATLKAHAQELGLGDIATAIKADEKAVLAMRDDPALSARAAALLARDNAAVLQKALGRAPTDGELYAAHFLGSAGAVKLLTADPNAVAAKLFAKAAKANPAIFNSPTGQPRTVAEVRAKLSEGFDGSESATAAGGGVLAGGEGASGVDGAGAAVEVFAARERPADGADLGGEPGGGRVDLGGGVVPEPTGDVVAGGVRPRSGLSADPDLDEFDRLSAPALGVAPAPAPAARQPLDYENDPGFARTLAALQEGRNPSGAAMRAPSLLEFVSKAGGVIDEGGELTDADTWHKAKGGRRKLVREGKGDETDAQHHADRVRERAEEAGYLPEGSTPSDLFVAMREELAGRRVYPAHVAADPEFQARALELDELEARLNRAGVSPKDRLPVIARALRALDAEEALAQADAEFEAERAGADRELAQGPVDVRSAAFQAWFGDSKAVDENGQPLVLYHGTNKEFEGFKPGSWFARDPGVASAFRNGRRGDEKVKKGGRVLPVYLSIQNPLDLTRWRVQDYVTPEKIAAAAGVDLADLSASAKEHGRAAFEKFAAEFSNSRLVVTQTVFGGASASIPDAQARPEDAPLWQFLDYPGLREALFDLGFDGIKTRETLRGQPETETWLAFRPEQVKSVHNGGAFNPEDPRILFQPAYHGSPHVFDRFSTDHMGSGEGVQAFGWGLYFAGRKEVAEYYREALTGNEVVLPNGNRVQFRNVGDEETIAEGIDVALDDLGVDVELPRAFSRHTFHSSAGEVIADAIDRLSGDWINLVGAYLREKAEVEPDHLISTHVPRAEAQEVAAGYLKAAELFDALKAAGLTKGEGRLYSVDIPEDNEFLLWDVPLADQPEAVKAAVAPRVEAARAAGAQMGEDPTGEAIYRAFHPHPDLGDKVDWSRSLPQQASLALLDQGVAGIKFLDGGSRADGEGSYNYVVFDGERVEIREYEQFAGVRAKTAPRAALGRAIQMDAEGELPGVIEDETGWFRGDDGDWRFEISDDKAAFRTGEERGVWGAKVLGFARLERMAQKGLGQAKLREIIDHPELFAAYPQLADVYVVVDKMRANAAMSGNTLLLADHALALGEDKVLDYIVHELQHAIQRLEGFAIGAGGSRDLLREGGYGDALNRAVAEGDETPVRSTYRRSAGEIEARNTEGRRKMTAEERAEVPGRFTRDIQPEQAIIVLMTREGPQEVEITFEASDFAQDDAGDPDGRRGSIQLPGPGLGGGREATIRLFEAADLSTFLHEGGHLFLELLVALGSRADAAPQLKADLAATLEWLGVSDPSQIEVAHHEKWAEGFEQYLSEGRAPSLRLQSAFEAFRSWLVFVYRKLAGPIRADLSDEVRAVMDRLLASDDEIAAARHKAGMAPLFEDAQAAGLTAEAAARYQTLLNRSVAQAHAEADRRVLAAVRRQAEKWWKEARAETREQVVAEVNARPVYRAFEWLANGRWHGEGKPADLLPMKLNTGALKAEFGGEETIRKLPRGLRAVHADNGADPDVAAMVFGFPSGQALVEALSAMEKRKAVIERETDERLAEEHGDPLNDGTLPAVAMAAAHNDAQGRVLEFELSALRGSPVRSAFREIAKREALGRKVADLLRPDRHLAAERKAANMAMDAYRAGDEAEAAMWKQRQLVAYETWRATRAAADEIEAAREFLRRFERKKVREKIPADYLEQIDALLDGVDMTQQSGAELKRRANLRAFVAEQLAQGVELSIPEALLEAAQLKNWREFSYAEFRGLTDAVKSLAHQGRRKKTLLDRQARADFDALVQQALDNALGLKGRGFSDQANPRPSKLRLWDAALQKVETWMDWLDGEAGVEGVFNRVLIRPAVDAANKANELTALVNDALAAARALVPKEQRKRWARDFASDVLTTPQTGGRLQMTRGTLIAVALNAGNASNWTKMTQGWGWDPDAVADLLNRELTAEEWAYVQAVWDALELLWPEIAATEKKLTGVVPERVEAREVATPHGTFRGGYYPVVYDPRTKGSQRFADLDPMDEAIRTASTPKGHTITRTDFDGMVSLSVERVLSGHVRKVVTRVAYADFVQSARKFINDQRVKDLVEAKVGPEYYAQMMPWLRRQVADPLAPGRELEGVEWVARAARANTQITALGFRLTTALVQVMGLAATAHEIGPVYVAGGLAAAAQPGARRFALERSGELRARNVEMDRDLRDAIRELDGRTDHFATAKRWAFAHIGFMDKQVSLATWLGAWHKAKADGLDDTGAGDFADKIVRRSQSSGRAAHLSAVQAPNSEFVKLFTMFYGPFNALYNQQRAAVRDAVNGRPGRLLSALFWLSFVAPLGSAFLTGNWPDEDDDESWLGWAAEHLWTGLWAGLPVARDGASMIAQKAKGERAPYPNTAIGRIAETVGETFSNLIDVSPLGDGEPTERWLQRLIETAGLLGAPLTGQIAATSQYLLDVAEGDQDPEHAGEFAHGLLKGPQGYQE